MPAAPLLVRVRRTARTPRTVAVLAVLAVVGLGGFGACAASDASMLVATDTPLLAPTPLVPPTTATSADDDVDGVAATLALTPGDTTLQVGDTVRIAVAARDSAGAALVPHATIWRVNGQTVASLVDGTGLVRATAPGDAWIVAAVDAVTDSVPLHVAATTDTATTDTATVDTATVGGHAVTVTPPAPPRRLDLDRVRFFDPARGRTLRVSDGGNLQKALDEAKPGDQILLARGARFRGSFTLRRKADRNGRWITLRTELGADSLPAGTRMTPEAAGRLRLASIVGTGNLPDPTITTEAATMGWRLVELDITADPALPRFGTLVRFGPSDLTKLEDMPGDLVLDRSWVHGQPTLDLLRCVLVNGTSTAVTNSTIDDCHAKGFDNYAIGGVTGVGPFKIVNNYLAGAGMGIFFGGADPRIKDVSPSDIEIRRNHITRPLDWQEKWTVKNFLEFKNAKRALIEENLFENHWVDGQAGPAIVLKSTNQSGTAPWSQTADVTFRFNVLRNAPGGMTIAAHPEARPATAAARIAVEDNLFYNIGAFLGTKNGRMLTLLGPLSDVSIARNTFLHGAMGTHAMLLDAARPSTNLSVVGNVFTRGTYGIWSSGPGEGAAAFEGAWPGSWEFRDNVVLTSATPRTAYPPSTRMLALSTLSALLGKLDDTAAWGDVTRFLDDVGAGGTVGVPLTALADHLRGVGEAPTPTPLPARRRVP